MSSIIYEKIGNSYECVKVINDGSDELAVIIDNDIDGTITLGDEIARLVGGVAQVRLEKAGSGIISPVIYTKNTAIKLERFIIKGGIIYLPDPDGEYIRAISKRCEELSAEVKSLEDEIMKMKDKIEKTTIF